MLIMKPERYGVGQGHEFRFSCSIAPQHDVAFIFIFWETQYVKATVFFVNYKGIGKHHVFLVVGRSKVPYFFYSMGTQIK